MTRQPRVVKVLVAAVLTVMVASGCSTTLGDVPLPGVGVSGETISLDAEFGEALNLARGATVKINGVDSGKVQEIKAKDFKAVVTMQVKTTAKLRTGASYRLRYTTPLGELFVDVTNPDSGQLVKSGATVDVKSTDTAPTVEDALSQASLLINGGGLADLQVITRELNTALGGREGTARQLLERSRTFLQEANATTADIDRALRSMSSVSVTLRDRQDIINRAVREIAPAADVLRKNTPGLTNLLKQVKDFSATANDTVDRTRGDILEMMRTAEPVLAEFTKNTRTYPETLRSLIALGRQIDGVTPGDYISITLALHLDGIALPDLGGLLGLLGLDIPGLPEITLPTLPNLPGLPNLPLLSKSEQKVTMRDMVSRGGQR